MPDMDYISTPRLVNAVYELADMVGEFEEFETLTSWTCMETDALADVFRAANRIDAAAAVIRAHAPGDNEGDDHFGMGCSDDEGE